MWDFFWTTFKAWVAAGAAVFFPGLGQLLITTFEKATVFDIPASAEAWFLGILVGIGAWFATWAAPNKKTA